MGGGSEIMFTFAKKNLHTFFSEIIIQSNLNVIIYEKIPCISIGCYVRRCSG